MAFEDAIVPPHPPEENRTQRACETCNAVMKQLVELPSFSIHAAIKIFRCYACDHVIADRT